MELRHGIWLASGTAPRWRAGPGALARETRALKQALAPDRPFAIALRLSARDAQAFDDPAALEALAEELQSGGLVVTSVNSAAFAGARPASKPDWRAPARRDHTLRLARILAALVPPGGAGGVSTLGLADRSAVPRDEAGAYEAMVEHLLDVVDWMHALEGRTGKRLHLDLEPEPGGLLESPAEVVRLYETRLLAIGVPRLARRRGWRVGEAEAVWRRHLRVSLDAGALAAAYEPPVEALARWERAGLAVGQIKLTTALKAPLPAMGAGRRALAEALAPLAGARERHPVVARFADGTTTAYAELGEALAGLEATRAREWRVRYALPVQEAEFGPFLTTQAELDALLHRLARDGAPRLLAIETAPAPELPAALEPEGLETRLRAYRWTLAGLAG